MRFRTIKTDQLSPEERSRMFQLMSRYYDDLTETQFDHDLNEKTDLILLIAEGEIQGFSTILRFEHKEIGGQRVQGLFSGDTVLSKEYWGNRALTIAFGLYLAKLVLSAPFRNQYWFLMSKGYKTYLLMTNNTLNHFPCYKTPTPPPIQQLIHQFYRDRFGADYDPKTGLVTHSQEHYRLKQRVADIEPHHLRNPNIAFFAERNPKWSEGVELACVAEINLLTVIHFSASLALRQFRSLAVSSLRRMLRPARG